MNTNIDNMRHQQRRIVYSR